VAIDSGRIVRDCVASEVLADSALEELGVAAPAAVRLARAAERAGIGTEALGRLREVVNA
jgi:hypothetical protein